MLGVVPAAGPVSPAVAPAAADSVAAVAPAQFTGAASMVESTGLFPVVAAIAGLYLF